FVTHYAKPYFGGTYFPPEYRYGRPSFQRVLQTMADAFRNRRPEVDESAGSVMQAIEYNESFSGRGGSVGPELVEKLVEACVKQFDTRFGGFGSQPKFPHAAAIDLLMDYAQRSVNETAAEKAKEAALITLEKMALGG